MSTPNIPNQGIKDISPKFLDASLPSPSSVAAVAQKTKNIAAPIIVAEDGECEVVEKKTFSDFLCPLDVLPVEKIDDLFSPTKRKRYDHESHSSVSSAGLQSSDSMTWIIEEEDAEREWLEEVKPVVKRSSQNVRQNQPTNDWSREEINILKSYWIIRYRETGEVKGDETLYQRIATSLRKPLSAVKDKMRAIRLGWKWWSYQDGRVMLCATEGLHGKQLEERCKAFRDDQHPILRLIVEHVEELRRFVQPMAPQEGRD